MSNTTKPRNAYALSWVYSPRMTTTNNRGVTYAVCTPRQFPSREARDTWVSNIKELFGRTNENGNVDVFYAVDGTEATQVDVDNLYPVGSSISSRYEHADGIEITAKDASRIGLEIE